MMESNKFSMSDFMQSPMPEGESGGAPEAAPSRPIAPTPAEADAGWHDELDATADAEALANDDFVGRAGLPLQPGQPVLDSDEPIIEALREVHDPEIPVNIYDLGLVYDILRSEDGDVKIRMTLTAPGCPVAGELPDEVAQTVARVRGVGIVEVYLVWEPAWTPDRMSEGARMLLDYF